MYPNAWRIIIGRVSLIIKKSSIQINMMLVQFGILCQILGNFCGSDDSIWIAASEKVPDEPQSVNILFKLLSGESAKYANTPNKYCGHRKRHVARKNVPIPYSKVFAFHAE